MTTKDTFPDWHNKPMKLTINEINHPHEILKEFCWEYTLPEAREDLWNLLVDALQYEDTNAGKAILFYDKLVKVLEAMYIIYTEKTITP